MFFSRLKGKLFYVSDDEIYQEKLDAVLEYCEKEIREALLKDAEKAGIKNASLVKLRVLDSKGNVYRPYYKNEWNEDRNPLMRLALNDYPKENDSSVFVYKNGEFRPVAAYRGYTGVFYMYINPFMYI